MNMSSVRLVGSRSLTGHSRRACEVVTPVAIQSGRGPVVGALVGRVVVGVAKINEKLTHKWIDDVM